MEGARVSAKRWLLPRNPDLLEMLREQTAVTAEAMAALVAWARGDPAAGGRVRDCEHRADATKRTLWRQLREAFSPPLDAEDLFTLSADFDEVLNGSKDLVREMEVMDMAPDEPTRNMVDLIEEAVRHLVDACTHLGTHDDVTRDADAAIKCQRGIEKIYRQAMSALLAVSDLREVVGRREVYRRLSRIGDSVRVVADRIWYAEVKEA
jgi:uncharacterized protein Yka (UPF0111/DUF47 family)